ncbi:O-antigen ligase family protein [Ramlibacter sp. PS4R-6]|uniref:O-antigen ligase family protein n=1 Tax=Ramlibacter sp. PS4R-6 TaxID=3133438 RepID=UPI0030B4A8BC
MLAAPLMRGGNRHAALIVLEALGLVALVSLFAQPTARARLSWPGRMASAAQWLLVVSPAVLAIVYLVPIPLAAWSALPGREFYVRAMGEAGVTAPPWLAISLVPQVTAASLLAGIPMVAAFLVGRACKLEQLKVLARIVVCVAWFQVVLGLLQVASGQDSPLYFGAGSQRPVGTFANSNHYANYLAAALILYIWQAFEPRSITRHENAIAWFAGGMLLVLGIVISRSRGAAATGLSAAVVAFAWAAAARSEDPGRKRRMMLLLPAAAATITALVGLDFLLSRLSSADLAGSASFRASLTRTTLAGAAELWPLGAGWGAYPSAYPRFQSADIPGFANHAHQDYAEMLFDGGVFALILVAAFVFLAAPRAASLVRTSAGEQRETRASALCGLGLLGFLLHSLVEFNMHIPANAILASLLAGVYLRPLDEEVSRP